MFKNLRKRIANIISPILNTMSLPEQFRRLGGKKMLPDWSRVVMDDKDFYTGYSFAAIRNRANAVARISTENIKTESKKEDFIHPYIETIDRSTTFTNYQFWSDISTYLDLEGIYYLMAIRNFDKDRMGDIQEFKLLNPYNVRRVTRIDKETGLPEVAGYVESLHGLQREIKPEMIIEMRELNPFNPEEPFAMTDAAKESQFTLKTSGDFTRNAIKHNINAPGILTTDVVLEDQDFENFKARVKDHTKGEPLFGNGKGIINWQSMILELSKAALKDINEINRDTLSAVAGVSKTIWGIEQSGTTRETSKVQVALFTTNHIIPRIQLMIDALNQDYKNTKQSDFLTNGAVIKVDNPLAIDNEADLKSTEVKQKDLDLYNDLLNKGYDPDLSAKYVNGQIGIEELGEPKPPDPIEIDTDDDDDEEVDNKSCKHHTNQAGEEKKGIVQRQQGALQNAITNIDEQLVAEAIIKVEKTIKNQFKARTDLFSKTKLAGFANELQGVLTGFYGIVMVTEGSTVMRKRISEFIMPGTFKLDRKINKTIKKLSDKVAKSHIDIISKDIWKTAREEALKGIGQKGVINAIKDKYSSVIVETRAKAIARTETNRAFTIAQFEADVQFIDQNKLEDRAFKQWRTRSDDPCPFCLALEDEGPIPFNKSFRDLGDTMEVDGKTLDINFEPLVAGNAHTNCSCNYELIIDTDNSLNPLKKEVGKLQKQKQALKKELEGLDD